MCAGHLTQLRFTVQELMDASDPAQLAATK